jgi:hypothetical protein
MYSTLGCFHTLQPTSSPFESPSIPALLPIGFVEWQRLQLLLLPGEHVPFMQEAVRRYDVPKPDGSIFPKNIPREAFPDRPDESMEKWHQMVTGRLEQAQYTSRRKNSPYATPRDAAHRGEEFHSSNGTPQVRRPSRSPRSSFHGLVSAHLSDERRRSSVPDIPSLFPSASENTYRGSDGQQFPPPNSRTRQAQYNAPHRASNTSSQHRTSDASSSRHRYSNSSHRTSNSSATYKQALGSSAESRQQVPPAHRMRHHRRSSSPSTIDESSSGSEASSENSHAGRGHNSHEARDGRRRSSLFPPDSAKHHVRRHSHDATYLSNGKPPLPPRPIDNAPHVQDPLLWTRPGSKIPATSGAGPLWNGGAVQFRNNVFEPHADDTINSVPAYAVPVENLSASINPKLHSFDPAGHRELVRQYDPADTNQDRADQRKSGMLLRTATVTGVGGRKYAATEPRSAFAGRM